MLKDFFRTKEISNNAQLITAMIVANYPPELDLQTDVDKKTRRKIGQKLKDALNKSTTLILDICKKLNLGIYGKAKLCKSIQTNLLELDYSTNRAINIVNDLSLAITQNKQNREIQADYVEAYYSLGRLHSKLGQYSDSVDCYKRALDIKPNYAEAQYGLGDSSEKLNLVQDAVFHYEQAISLRPDYAEAHNNLGNVLNSLDRQKDAVAHFEKGITIRPDFATAHVNLGYTFQTMGRFDDAVSCFLKAVTIKPDFAEAHRLLSIIGPDQKYIARLEKYLARPSTSDTDAMHYHFALGNIYESINSFDKVFNHYHAANLIKRKTINYDPKQHSSYIDDLIETYSRDFFKKNTIRGSDSELPVFIVGMPRSGTTLVEQILSSHPDIYGAGEVSFLENIEKAIPGEFKTKSGYPMCITMLKGSHARDYSAAYLEKLRDYAKQAIRITDKVPDNFLRIGLIKILFPNARIIHCQRNALDTCTSIYLNYFASFQNHQYSFDLAETGQYYLDYERLMAHWYALFPSEIFDIQYENLVMEQETASRKLIEYLGLNWDEECLNFHLNKRTVKTTSNLQVRRSVYKGSIHRWRNYEQHLNPLTATLGEQSKVATIDATEE